MDASATSRIQVAVRIRPPNAAEKHSVQAVMRPDGDDNGVMVLSEEIASSVNDGASQSFRFDHVFDDSDNQQRVYEDGCLGIIDTALDGRFVTIFAYGQTGSGKTHTILGAPARPDGTIAAETGLFLRVFEALFDYRRKMRTRMQVLVALSAVEVYVGTIYDLLGNRSEVQMRSAGDDSRLVGLKYFEVSSIGEVLQHFAIANAARTTASTKMNAESSRSHALFFIDLFMVPTQVGASAPKELTVTDVIGNDGNVSNIAGLRHARISLVDLAGSERVKRSGVEGHELKEANAINGSLMTLGRVINDLHEGRGHVPFRDAVLTKILKSALVDPNSRLLLIGQVSPSAMSVAESLQTLKFCDRLKSLRAPEVQSGPQPDLQLLEATAATSRKAAEMAADVAIAAARCHHKVTRPRFRSRHSGDAFPSVMQASQREVAEHHETVERRLQEEQRQLEEEELAVRTQRHRESVDFRWASITQQRSAAETAYEAAVAAADQDAATLKEITDKAMTKAKRAKKTRVQLEEKKSSHGPNMEALERELEEISTAAFVAGRKAQTGVGLSKHEEAEVAEEEHEWGVREGNHGIVVDFAKLANPLGQLHEAYLDAVKQRYKAQIDVRMEAKKVKASKRGTTEITTSVIPDVIAFAIERAVHISEGDIDETDPYSWFDIKGASRYVVDSHFWEPPLNTTAAPETIPLPDYIEAHDATFLSEDEDDIGTPMGSGPATPTATEEDVRALEVTHAQAVRMAREKRKDKSGTVSKRIESEEANQKYLMTVYDSPTLVQDVARFLTSGTTMIKHGRSGDPHRRKVWVSSSSGHRLITWEDPEAQKPSRSSVPVSQISKIVLGPYSKVFKRHPKQTSDSSFFFSFTLHTKDNSRTLDLVADALVDFEAWVLGLSHLAQVDPLWGQPLDISKDNAAKELSSKEAALCSKENLPPATYLAIRSRVTAHRDEVAHQLSIFDNDPIQAFRSIGGIHAPQLNPKGAVLMTKGELRYHCSNWNIDIFRVCKIWKHFREMDIIFDPGYLPATCFGTTTRS